MLVAATHQASENLWAAHAKLTFRTGCMLRASVQTHTHTLPIAAVPGGFKESQYFLELAQSPEESPHV